MYKLLTPSMSTRLKEMSVTMKNKCHTLPFSDLTCTSVGVHRVLRNKLEKVNHNGHHHLEEKERAYRQLIKLHQDWLLQGQLSRKGRSSPKKKTT